MVLHVARALCTHRKGLTWHRRRRKQRARSHRARATWRRSSAAAATATRPAAAAAAKSVGHSLAEPWKGWRTCQERDILVKSQYSNLCWILSLYLLCWRALSEGVAAGASHAGRRHGGLRLVRDWCRRRELLRLSPTVAHETDTNIHTGRHEKLYIQLSCSSLTCALEPHHFHSTQYCCPAQGCGDCVPSPLLAERVAGDGLWDRRARGGGTRAGSTDWGGSGLRVRRVL